MSLEVSTESKKSIKYNNKESSIPVINEYICDIQACLAQYITVSAMKHMELKESYNKNKTIEEIVVLFNELNDHLNEGINDAFEITHKHLIKYFNGRAKFQPRITIKAPYKDKSIVDLYRKDKSPFRDFNVEENTAFKYIMDSGKFYICNNIPVAVKEEKYINKRINGKTVRNNYKCKGKFSKLLQSVIGQPENDPPWENCWDLGVEDRPHTDSCYKSTLVVPMTLINSTLCKEFRKYMLEDIEEIEKEDKYKKLMFGFLCMDHRHTDFFNSESDIRIGYIISDIISLFLIVRMMYTSKSRTYMETSSLIN